MKFEIIAGDFHKNTKYLKANGKICLRVLEMREDKPYPVPYELNLVGNIANVEMVTEENKKRILGSAGWGVAGLTLGGIVGLAAGGLPLAIVAGIAGILKGGNTKEVCLACHLRDGRKFMAIVDVKIYREICALAFSG